jgi:hypothetical protein
MLLVTVFGVVLTGASVIASFAQYRAADLQAQAAVAALMPQLEVTSSLIRGEGESAYTDRVIDIAVEGGPIKNFQTERQTWLAVEDDGKESCRIPISGYYFQTKSTGRSRGEIQQIAGYRNNQKYLQAQAVIAPMLTSGSRLTEPVTLLRVRFLDSLRRNNNEYYKIRGGSVEWIEHETAEVSWAANTREEDSLKRVELDELTRPEFIARFLSRCATQRSARGAQSMGGGGGPIEPW